MSADVTDFRQHVAEDPAVALQTYEWFMGDKDQRDATKHSFLANEIDQPVGEYPKLSNISELTRMGQGLDSLLSDLRLADDMSPAEVEAYEGTLGYRQREVDFLMTAAGLNSAKDDDTLIDRAADFTDISCELYGRPHPFLIDGVVAEIRSNFAQKDFVGQAADLHDEVVETLDSLVTDSTVTGLPTLSEEANEYLEEKIEQYFAPEKQAVAEVQAIMEIAGEDAFSPLRMLDVFQRAIQLRRYSGVGAAIVDDNILSWSQKDRRVSIGRQKREAPIQTEADMWGIAVHELGVHGQRFVRGQSSKIPVIGNGLFMKSDDESPDYLAFEEGIAGLYQSIAAGSKNEWTMEQFKHILNVALSEQGHEFRGVFDQSWKIGSLLLSKDGRVDDDLVEKSRALAYDAVFRIFRGTPMHRLGELSVVATYNKDLAYLPGKVGAVQFWNEHAGDDNVFDFLLSGKFDPTNRRQLAIARAA